jgi:site-specific DNA-methyltransferase (adenine-specific)
MATTKVKEVIEEEEEEEEVYVKVIPNSIFEVKLNDLTSHPDALKIYDYNSKKQVKVLAQTMKTAGQLEPIVINTKNVIISGHRRMKAAYFLGWTELKAIRVEAKEDETVSIVYHNQQRKKSTQELIKEAEAILGILGKKQGQRKDLYKSEKNNEFGIIGKDRFEIAAKVIGDISGITLRRLMDIVDFEKESEENKNLGIVERIFKNEVAISRGHALMKTFIKDKEDRSAAVKKRSKIKAIDIKDAFVLYNKSSEKMSEIKPKTIQVVFTSPPYYNLRNYGNKTSSGVELGHENTPAEFIQHLTNHFKDIKRILKDEGSFFLNIGDTIRDGASLLIPNRLVLSLCDNEGWKLVNEIIWQKTNALPNVNDKRLQTSYEKIFHLVKDTSKYYYQEYKNWDDTKTVALVKSPSSRSVKGIKSDGGLTLSKTYTKFKDFLEEQNVKNVIKGTNAGPRQSELKKLDPATDHPALMPEYLPVIPILTTSKEGDIVLDPFSGSGTVGKSALLLSRKYVGYELNKSFYDLSNQDLLNTFQEGTSHNLR